MFYPILTQTLVLHSLHQSNKVTAFVNTAVLYACMFVVYIECGVKKLSRITEHFRVSETFVNLCMHNNTDDVGTSVNNHLSRDCV